MSEHAQRLYEQRYGTEETDPERRAYAKGPEYYARAARWVNVAMRASARPCSRDGCDEGEPCKRHRAIPELVDRWLRRYSSESEER